MEEAIAAVATGQGRSAIGVIRLSGEGCIDALARVFRCKSGLPLDAGAAGQLVLGTLLDGQGAPLDQALATFSRAPHSYTGEDTCELHCHGSPAVLAAALEGLFAQGVRQAGPGEFTKRAFLNGKLDLMEAEAVADLIDAPTPAAARQAAGQLSGALSGRVAAVYDALVDLLAHFHAEVDYPDEDVAPLTDAALAAALARASAELTALVDSYHRGRIVREGVTTALVGRPNVGKSTLLNALVGYDRAIVTDRPGTTRDTLEEPCVLGETLLRLTDTAGIRASDDAVEQLGVERSRAVMERAGLILVVLDRSQPPTGEDLALAERAVALAPTVLVLNKTDRPAAAGWSEWPVAAPLCPLSARTGEGLPALAEQVAALFPAGEDAPGELLANLRQVDCARRALAAVRRAHQAQEEGLSADLVLLDVEEGLAALSELTGRAVRDDVVERIFARFCVGK